jgi:hypothetical protein
LGLDRDRDSPPFGVEMLAGLVSFVAWDAVLPDGDYFPIYEGAVYFGEVLSGIMAASLIYAALGRLLFRRRSTDRPNQENVRGPLAIEILGLGAWWVSPLLWLSGLLSLEVALSLGSVILIASIVLARRIRERGRETS